ncbi:NACHT domain-containing protein [Kitasatospora phosalacinea]|uniref:NACHT domain-containing protein n=1 Tax=Kitasatospora phosalacinea TaxID=2065 RepID=A0A9W6PMX0_9ACTN|nr:NACHT domain-containing protein [Kitasatospora phosalacinea]GLW57966.1 hypothetical protein Kpho01_59770 [Kitasatospora phosalacinea]
MAPSTAPRVAAVRADSQGSGCLLTPRLVLTVAHVHAPSAPGNALRPAEAAVLGGNGWTPCTTVWESAELDAALLLADRDLTPARLEPLRWGAVDSPDPVAGVHLTGFPATERDLDHRLDTAQALATLTPGTGRRTDRPALVLQQHPPRPVPDTPSPWSGLSGAPVLYRGRLLGLAVHDRTPEVWAHSQLDLLPVTALLADEGFRTALAAHLGELPHPEGISAEEIADADFERDYAKAVEADYGRIRIFGLRQSNRLGWDLSACYLNLEMLPTEVSGLSAPVRQRTDRILQGRRRVLVRGEAGSGKTTLVQWLATRTMSGTLDGELSEFNHRVPLVLQLRKLHRQGTLRPRPEEFLALDDRMCADRQPTGWVHRLLRSRRALLLVDGLDEVPDEQRDEVREWLRQLLANYPDTLVLATVRPSAVPRGWLEHLDFDELSLCPMDSQDRHRFVEHWHRAALAELLDVPHTDAEEQRWRRQVEQDRADLLRTLDTVPEVAQLTDSPLLCAMICVLNRETDGALPRQRMVLYRDALSVMLVKRDEGRRVQGAEQLQASEEEQLAMLRRIAHWLVRNNQVEGRRQDAVAQLAKALRDLPALARRTAPERAYTHLLNRSGLLTETGPDTFQFIHRTFQDYLAAMEFREERDFGLLAGHAADEQWNDVIRMTVGHCGRRERAELLTALLKRGAHASPEDSGTVHLLAATCLPNAPELDGEVRDAVLQGLRPHLRQLLATREPTRLAAVGEDLVPLLREITEHDQVFLEEWGHGVPAVLGRIGGNESLALLEILAGAAQGRSFRRHLMRRWNDFEVREFGRRVAARIDLTGVLVTADQPGQVEELRHCPTLHRIQVSGRHTSAEAQRWTHLTERVDHLVLVDVVGLTDLAFLRGWQPLNFLGLLTCPDLHDLTALAGTHLRRLLIREVPAERRTGDLFAVLSSLVGLREVALTAPELGSAPAPEPVVDLPLLRLYDVPTDYPFDLLLLAFPGLGKLAVESFADACTSIDLRPLGGAHRIELAVRRKPPTVRVIGEELFPSAHPKGRDTGSDLI